MKFVRFLVIGLFVVIGTSCSDDEPALSASVNITTNIVGDIGGDVVGNGGDYTSSYTYTNNMPTADFNMDITSSQGGSFKLVVKDADGTIVLDRTLTKGQGDDSASGVTSQGTAGVWSVDITLTTFNGDGSFSLSEGN